MVEHPEASQSAETLSSREWIDDIADRYEAAWQQLKPPCPADFLGNAAGELRNALLGELSKIDAAYRERLTGLDEPLRRPDEVAATGGMSAATPLPAKALLVGAVPGGPAGPGFAVLA